ncbi:MAG TPA: hypothetical protein VLV54_17760 [Thermoanaerobaculia bacterium]|nr:hypothetical protein [Thermoanaerobaculia bacterium]
MTRFRRGLDLLAGAGRRVPAGLLVLFVAVAVPLAAQPLRWTAIGSRGGGIANLATAAGGAGIVWAGWGFSGLGLWRSLDGGASWVPAALADPQSYYAAATDPVDPLVVYAEGANGLAKTIDGGATWTVINPTPVGAFAIAPSAPATLYLASEKKNQPVVLRSDDRGATWQRLPPLPPPTQALYELDVDPVDPNRIYALGYYVFDILSYPTFLRSTDGGKSWISVDLQDFAFKLQIDGRAPWVVYRLHEQGPMRSHDYGATWEPATAGLPAHVTFSDMVLDPATRTLLLAGLSGSLSRPLGQVWRSADGGTSWTKLSERSSAIQPLALDRTLPGRVYAGANDVGLLVSVDSGQHWQVANAGFVPLGAYEVAFDPRTPRTLYEVTEITGLDFYFLDTQIARSQDGGATWERWTPYDENGPLSQVGGLAIDPFAAGSLYISAPWPAHSVDGGKTWRSLNSLPAGFEIESGILVDPLHAGTLFLAGHLNDRDVVLRSADGGTSWATVLDRGESASFAGTLFADPTSPGVLLAGGRGGFWRSVNGGQTWTFKSLGAFAGDQWAFSLQTDSSHDLYAWLVPAGPDLHTLYRSADQGATWTAIDGGLPADIQINDFVADPQGTALYAGTSDGVYLSQDGGAHWAAANQGLVSSYVNRLALDPTRGGTLYAATLDDLYVSSLPANFCMPSDAVLCLAGGRFAARVHWSLTDGTAGDAHAAALTDGSGSFGFWSPRNVELTLKMIDGRDSNHHFWLFGAVLTDVAYTLTVTEMATGLQRTYRNPRGRFANFADTDAFDVAGTASAGAASLSLPASIPPVVSASTSGCAPAADTLCLARSRFAVRVDWSLPGAGVTPAVALPLVRNTGAFWFFSPQLPELVVKVFDGRSRNGHFWVFLSGLSSVAYSVTVTDTVTGARKRYDHPAGALAAVEDTSF